MTAEGVRELIDREVAGNWSLGGTSGCSEGTFSQDEEVSVE
jgi:hypothetical protein